MVGRTDILAEGASAAGGGGATRSALVLVAGCLVVAAGVWLSSGTLAPYAATLEQPRIEKPCNYLVNPDHVHFEAAFLMLDGEPRQRWDFSIYLRRILYPLLAYPLMKWMGFMAGGVLASGILQIAAFATFVLYVRRTSGRAAGYAAVLLVASYPGTYYWAGLPYNHVMIVPASLCGMVLLRELEHADAGRRVAALSLLLGVLFLAYDLMPLFAPPAVLILLVRRRLPQAGLAALMLLLPSILTNVLLDWKYGLGFRNKNTQAYYDILQAYLHPARLSDWAHLVSKAPGDFVRTFFFSNFWFLPALFFTVVVANRFTLRLRMTAAERWLLLATSALFAFINLAPPTPGWQFRGSGTARIYQPAFAAMILYVARWTGAAWEARGPLRRPVGAVLAGATCANALVVFGPALHVALSDHVYLSFYRHAERPVLSKNLDTFGRRPLGFCDERIDLQNPPTRRELKLLKQQRAKAKAKAKPPKVSKPKKKPATTRSPKRTTALSRPMPLTSMHVPEPAAGEVLG